MSEHPSSPHLSKTEQILDLLLDALLERQAARQALSPQPAPPPTGEVEQPSPLPLTQVTGSADLTGLRGEPVRSGPEISDAPPGEVEAPEEPGLAASSEPEKGATGAEPGAWEVHEKALRAWHEGAEIEEEWTPPAPLPSINLGRAMARLFAVLGVLVVLINIPLNLQGVSLARMIPDSAALIIRDGLVLKGSGPDIYVLQDNKLRWISSLEAFDYFGYQWGDVHVVEDSFLQQFEKGRPIHVLLKCPQSPHIYALESGRKRWIKDIPTFTAEGYVWEDVKTVDCYYLRQLPNGTPIPEDAGPPPEP
jgi:hypothetical protein